jgi:uroporphyrinogen-III synthase
MAIGQKVAEAAKEHGVAVSEPEKLALNEIKTALGLEQ